MFVLSTLITLPAEGLDEERLNQLLYKEYPAEIRTRIAELAPKAVQHDDQTALAVAELWQDILEPVHVQQADYDNWVCGTMLPLLTQAIAAFAPAADGTEKGEVYTFSSFLRSHLKLINSPDRYFFTYTSLEEDSSEHAWLKLVIHFFNIYRAFFNPRYPDRQAELIVLREKYPDFFALFDPIVEEYHKNTKQLLLLIKSKIAEEGLLSEALNSDERTVLANLMEQYQDNEQIINGVSKAFAGAIVDNYLNDANLIQAFLKGVAIQTEDRTLKLKAYELMEKLQSISNGFF